MKILLVIVFVILVFVFFAISNKDEVVDSVTVSSVSSIENNTKPEGSSSNSKNIVSIQSPEKPSLASPELPGENEAKKHEYYSRLYEDNDHTTRAYEELGFQWNGVNRGEFDYFSDLNLLLRALAKGTKSDHPYASSQATYLLSEWITTGIGNPILKSGQLTSEQRKAYKETSALFEQADIKKTLLTLVKDTDGDVKRFAIVGLMNLDPLSNEHDSLIVDAIEADDSKKGKRGIQSMLYSLIKSSIVVEGLETHPPRPISSPLAISLYGLLNKPDSKMRNSAIKILVKSKSPNITRTLFEGLASDVPDNVFSDSIEILKTKDKNVLSQYTEIDRIGSLITDPSRRSSYADFLLWISKTDS